MDTTNPDALLHVFETTWGPPDVNTPPVCGAKLTREYDGAGWNRPHCPECDRILADWRAARERKAV